MAVIGLMEAGAFWCSKPLELMAIAGFTHTQAPLPPPTDPFKPNEM
jgi:hypothetical protein